MAGRGLKLSPKAIAAQLAMKKVPSPFGHPSYGKGGRQSNAGITAAVFGSYGFLGRYVVGEMGMRGCKVYAPFRGCEMEVRHLKTSFDLGMLGQEPFSPRDEDSIRKAVKHADVVVNLIGKHYETKHVVKTRRADGSLSNINYDFDEVHSKIPATIARISKECGVESFIHMSAMSADPNSASKWSRSKAAGELAVREEFPEAIIVRPSNVFGPEDSYMNWYGEMAAMLPYVPLVNNGETLCQPVHCSDVGRAVMSILYNYKAFEGSTFLLAGPTEYTQRELMEHILRVTAMEDRSLFSLPKELLSLYCKANQLGWNPHFTEDNLEQMMEDNVLTEDLKEKVARSAAGGAGVHTFADLGIEPLTVEKTSYEFLHRFRTGGHFARIQGYH